MKTYILNIALLLFPFITFAQHTISGQITSPEALAICDVLVELKDANGLTVSSDYSNSDGTFMFDNQATGDYSLHFGKDDSVFNGISTLDMVLTSKSILGIVPLNTYGTWAADLNGDGAVSTMDIILMRRIILNIDSNLDLELWAFDEANTFPPNNEISISLTQDVDVDIIGVKRGDVNESVSLTACE